MGSTKRGLTMRRIMPVLVIIVLLAAAGAAYVLTRPKAADTTATTETTPSTTEVQTTNIPTETQEETAEAITITYTASGFSPASVTLKSGQQVTVVNNSGRSLQLSSNPHPAHTQNSELNQSTLASGRSQTFTMTKTGTWGYHNHLDDDHTGEITVQ